MIDYLNLTRSQAQTALQEFLDERGPALDRLREALAAAGQSPDALLDGTVDSLVPLWRWILSRLTRRDATGATDPATVPREDWPSWERYTMEQEGILSMESLALLDGLVSYLATVIRNHAPSARWEIARHRIKRYAANNHPVLVSGTGENHNFLPGVPQVNAQAVLLGIRESPDDKIARYARAVIDSLNRADNEAGEGTAGGDEPLVEVKDLGEDPRRVRELELSFREDIAHEHSRTVDRLAKQLKKQDGITGVLREDREVLLVATPTWTTTQLEQWATDYLSKNLT